MKKSKEERAHLVITVAGFGLAASLDEGKELNPHSLPMRAHNERHS